MFSYYRMCSLTELCMRRCSACGAAEGTKSAKSGKLVDKLVHCLCNPHGLPLYCGAECQRHGRKDHAEFCTYTKPDKKKKIGGREEGY